MSDHGDPLSLHPSQLFPSGNRLVEILQSILDDGGRLTRGILDIEHKLDPAFEPFHALDCQRECRWNAALLLHDFLKIFEECLTIAKLAMSISTETDFQRIWATFEEIRSEHIVHSMVTRLGRQKYRVEGFQRAWETSVVPEMTVIRQSTASRVPAAPRQGRFAYLFKKRTPPKWPDLPDLSESLAAISEISKELVQRHKELDDFWATWGMGPPESRDTRRPKVFVDVSGWLKSEWDVEEDLAGLTRSMRKLCEQICNEPPKLVYVLT